MTIVAGFATIGALGVAAAQVAAADQVYPYSTSPYFGGQVHVSTGPGNITIRAIQTTVGAFPYGCWANARNMEGNWSTGSRPLVQLVPRIWQVSFDGLPSGRYEVMQRCGDGTSLIRERAVIVELGGGPAVTPEEAKPFDPGTVPGGTCSERISRTFQDGGVPIQMVDVALDFLRRPGLEQIAQTLCLITVTDPQEGFSNVCRVGKSLIPADLVYSAIAELGRSIGSEELYRFGDSARQSWSHQCE
ncbi:hypothetical protein [Nocardia barduliensis]|uniref:hypothetical protein n=1 Tax=Nocardia barduliensis TaxID=2736643 RepID=UPI001573F1C1|nr:hypothetical protein [Nocardia barduliensis]